MARQTSGRSAKGRARGQQLDARKLLISGFQIRRAVAWPDIEERSSETDNAEVRVIIESDAKDRAKNLAEIRFGGSTSVRVNGVYLAQLAACFVRAASNAVRDAVVAPLSPESTLLLARMEAAVAQGDADNA